jgi:hypothetical protein
LLTRGIDIFESCHCQWRTRTTCVEDRSCCKQVSAWKAGVDGRYDMLCFEGIALALSIFQGKSKIPQYKLSQLENLHTLTIHPEVGVQVITYCRPRKSDLMLLLRSSAASNSQRESINLSSPFRTSCIRILLVIELLLLLEHMICLRSRDPLRTRRSNLMTSSSCLSTRQQT